MRCAARVPEADDYNESFLLVVAPERGHASDLYFLGGALDGRLKILRVVVLASENDNIFQSAADK